MEEGKSHLHPPREEFGLREFPGTSQEIDEPGRRVFEVEIGQVKVVGVEVQMNEEDSRLPSTCVVCPSSLDLMMLHAVIGI